MPRQILNRANLPPFLVQALTHSNYDEVGHYSVTSLIDSPRIFFLSRRHEDEIQEDAMDKLWAVRGSALHEVLAGVTTKGARKEERFLVHIAEHDISMQPDLLIPTDDPPGTYVLYDFKDTSIWTLKNAKRLMHWARQLNCYRYGFEKRGFRVSRIANILFLKDWSYTEAHIKKTRDYPQEPIAIVDQPIATMQDIEEYLIKRTRLFAAASKMTDDDLPECSLEERWGKPDRYRVTKKDSDRALPGGAHFNTRVEAEQFAATRKDAVVHYTPGTNDRCDRYCPVAAFCNQAKALRAGF